MNTRCNLDLVHRRTIINCYQYHHQYLGHIGSTRESSARASSVIITKETHARVHISLCPVATAVDFVA